MHSAPGHVNKRGLRLEKRTEARLQQKIPHVTVNAPKEHTTRVVPRPVQGPAQGYAAPDVPQPSTSSADNHVQKDVLTRISKGGAPTPLAPLQKKARDPPVPTFHQWKVLKSPNIPVRAEPAMNAKRVGMKFAGEVVWATAPNEDGWVCLQDDGGWLLTELPSFGKLLSCLDSSMGEAPPASISEIHVKPSRDLPQSRFSGASQNREKMKDASRTALPDLDFTTSSRCPSRNTAPIDSDLAMPNLGRMSPFHLRTSVLPSECSDQTRLQTSSRCPSRGAAAIDAHAGQL